jgi:hypothetical protein
MLLLKIRFWNTAIAFVTWLKIAVEARASKSIGLIGGGMMLVDESDNIVKMEGF